jgi:hypothetical protein
MTGFWRALEKLPGLVAAPTWWRSELNDDFDVVRAAFLRLRPEPAAAYACPHECGCFHEVVRHDATTAVAVCVCGQCIDPVIEVSAEDLGLLELNWGKLGRGIVRALSCDVREAAFGVRGVTQIGSFSGSAVPITFIIQHSAEEFRAAVAELVVRLGGRFALLAPTGQFLDVPSREHLARAGAIFVDLESALTLLPSGLLHCQRTAGELFSGLVTAPAEEFTIEEARKLYALVLAFQSDAPVRKAPLRQVFDLYCKAGLSAEQVAAKLRCSKAIVINRLATLRQRTGVSADKLRGYLPFFKEIESTLEEPRGRRRQSALLSPGLRE